MKNGKPRENRKTDGKFGKKGPENKSYGKKSFEYKDDGKKTPRYATKDKPKAFREDAAAGGKAAPKGRPDAGFRKPRAFEVQAEEPAFDESINLIEGRNPVLEALKSGREIDKLFIQKGAEIGSIRQIISMARDKNILIKEVDKAKLDSLSQTKSHQGVIASAALYKYYEVDEILQIAADKGEDPFLLILDEITDNNNLGSVLRTADAAGVHGIIIPKRRSVSLTPAAAKASVGAIEYVPVSKVTNLNQTIEYLKKKGLWIVGADMKGDTYYEKDMTGPVAVVIGSEGEGIARLIKENCDYLVSIPMKGKISSLNAAVSAAIIVYEINKQRSGKRV